MLTYSSGKNKGDLDVNIRKLALFLTFSAVLQFFKKLQLQNAEKTGDSF